MITAQATVDPLALMLADGGSTAAAMRITYDVIQRLVDAGGNRHPLTPCASWVAIIPLGRHDDPETRIDLVDWDPHTAIPRGTYLLRCTGYTVSTRSEVRV